MSPEEMRARADTCERMAASFGPGNSEMMREVAALWHQLADDAEARPANPLRPLEVRLLHNYRKFPADVANSGKGVAAAGLGIGGEPTPLRGDLAHRVS